MADETGFDIDLANEPIVTLNVGKPPVVFLVHRCLFCDASPVLRATFLGSTVFEETKTQTADLDEDDPQAFRIITQWLYTDRCRLPKYNANSGSGTYFMNLVTVYAVAEKYSIVLLKNELINQLIDFKKIKPMPKPPPTKVVSYAYSTTPATSPLRQLLVAWYTWHIDLSFYTYDSTPEILSSMPDFAADVACSLGSKLKGVVKSSPFDGDPTIYHEDIRSAADESRKEENIQGPESTSNDQ